MYDINRRHLDGRFLKRDEIVSSGESLLLDGHLVEVGEQEKCKSPTDLNIQGKSCIVVGKSGIVDYQAKIPIDKQLTAGIYPLSLTIHVLLLQLNVSSFLLELGSFLFSKVLTLFTCQN